MENDDRITHYRLAHIQPCRRVAAQFFFVRIILQAATLNTWINPASIGRKIFTSRSIVVWWAHLNRCAIVAHSFIHSFAHNAWAWNKKTMWALNTEHIRLSAYAYKVGVSVYIYNTHVVDYTLGSFEIVSHRKVQGTHYSIKSSIGPNAQRHKQTYVANAMIIWIALQCVAYSAIGAIVSLRNYEFLIEVCAILIELSRSFTCNPSLISSSKVHEIHCLCLQIDEKQTQIADCCTCESDDEHKENKMVHIFSTIRRTPHAEECSVKAQ